MNCTCVEDGFYVKNTRVYYIKTVFLTVEVDDAKSSTLLKFE